MAPFERQPAHGVWHGGFSVDGLQANTNFLGDTQYAFNFVVSPDLMRQGVLWALAIGTVGGLFPAIRAGRMPIVRALNEL